MEAHHAQSQWGKWAQPCDLAGVRLTWSVVETTRSSGTFLNFLILSACWEKKKHNKKAIYILSSQCRVRNCESRWSQAPWVLLENTTAESGLRFLSVLTYHLMSSLAVSDFFSPGLPLPSVTGERDTSNTCIPSQQRTGTPTIFYHHCSWERFTYIYNFFCTSQSTRKIFVVVVSYLAISNGSKQFFVYMGRCLHRTSY